LHTVIQRAHKIQMKYLIWKTAKTSVISIRRLTDTESSTDPTYSLTVAWSGGVGRPTDL